MMRDKEDGVEEGAEFSDMDMSALNEIGNIVSGSYLTAISKLTNLKMISTVPEMTIDMIGALLSVPASESVNMEISFYLYNPSLENWILLMDISL